MGSRHYKYTEEQCDFIEKNVRGISNYELAELFNQRFNTELKPSQIKSYKNNHNLKNGLDGRFSKGHEPFNKGKKGCYARGCEKTWFKKGCAPVNYRPVGSERVNVDGYIEVKVADPSNWKLKHILAWEEQHGPVPNGYVVIFGDGDKSNINLDNLILVSRSQLLALNRNHLIQRRADLTRTAVIIVDVKTKIGQKGGCLNDK